MPKRRPKKKSAPSGDTADQRTPQQPQTSEGSPDQDDSPSAPKKKKARRRRRKKPAAAETSTDQKKPEQEKPAATAASTEKKRPRRKSRPPKTDDHRKKKQAPRTSQGRSALEEVPPVAAGPARGRRTGFAAGGKPRKGRTIASLTPPEPPTPNRTRKPTRPKPTPSTEAEPPASYGARPKRKTTSAEPKPDTDRTATPSHKKREGKRAERKQPVAKTRSTATKDSREEREKKPTPAKPPRDQAKKTAKREAVPKSEKKPTPAEPPREQAREAKPKETVASGGKKRPKRRRKSAEPRPVEPRPESAPFEIAPADTEPVAAEVRQTELEPKEKKKPRDKEPKPARERGPIPPFGDLALSDHMLEALAEAGYQDPTPVQAGLIPKALKGHDLMGQARTGTGKTAAFGIPLLERFGSGEKRKGTAALILVPTRELAVQVRDEITKLAGRSKVTTVAVYGGKPIRGQIEHLRRGAEIVVGTPGRVIDLIDRRALILEALECVVLDEADRMLDIGFRPDIEKILRRCPHARQTLLLSATIPPPVKRLAERYMIEPEMLDFSPQDVAVETIEQFYFTVDPRQKFDLLVKLIEREDPKQAIIFCRTRKGTDRVGTRLGRKLKGAAMIHGDLQQRQRDRVMADFRAGNVRFLAATDVVGRGIDVTGISHIINFDIPQFCDDYIHRVGRTGRMGREGVAYTFVSPEEGNELTRIEVRINRLLVRDEMPGFLAVPKPEATEEVQLTPEGEQPKPKPVFGKRTRRIRRAL